MDCINQIATNTTGYRRVYIKKSSISDNNDASRLANAIASNTTLKYIDFTDSSGDDVDNVVVAIGDGLVKNTALKGLFLETQIGNAGSSAIAEVIIKNTTLQYLTLLGYRNITIIAEALTANTTLKHLDLDNIRDDEVIAIGEAIDKNTTLQTLILCYGQFGNSGAIKIASVLGNNRLRELDLSRNTQIGLSGYIAITDVLAKNNTLREIRLNCNMIGDSEAIEFANALAKNTVLKTLALNFNQIGDVGAVAIANALVNNNVLTRLELDYNKITGSGAVAIVDALVKNVKNTALRHLYLRDIEIHDVGAAIAVGIAKNTTLENLVLHSQVEDKWTERIGQLLKWNRLKKKQKHMEIKKMGEGYITKQYLDIWPTDLFMVFDMTMSTNIVLVCKSWRNLISLRHQGR